MLINGVRALCSVQYPQVDRKNEGNEMPSPVPVDPGHPARKNPQWSSNCIPGNFIRQQLEIALAKKNMERGRYTRERSPGEQSGYTTCALENVALQTLRVFCDPDTAMHAQRLVYLAQGTGVRLGLAKEAQFHLRLTALLHDIGKVGIPAALLRKPGPLNEEEMAIVRLHPQIGGQMLMMAGGLFASLAPIVVAHHEFWDGSGYPLGLAGEEIPLLARILAVVDAYDAMTSYRVYASSLSAREAYCELERCAGSQFDPRVVTAFLALLAERNVQYTPCLSSFSLLMTFPQNSYAAHTEHPFFLPQAEKMDALYEKSVL